MKLKIKLNDDGYAELGSCEIFFMYSPKERWIGLKTWRRPNDIDQAWLNRTGKKQLYLLQLLPCLGIAFHITRWTTIKKEKKR